jgi:hypothetical protein
VDLSHATGTSPLGFSGMGFAFPLSSLAYSERYARERGLRQHKTLTEWAWQLLVLGAGVGIRSARSWPSLMPATPP